MLKHIKLSEDKFRTIYMDHYKMVRQLIYNMTGKNEIDDLTQEAFVKIWQGLSAFSSQSSLKTWIYRITINVTIDYLRKQKSEKNKKDNLATELNLQKELQRSNEISSYINFNNPELVQKTLLQLEEVTRSMLILFYFEEKNIKDISKILEIPTGTVKSRLHNARKEFKHILKNLENIENADKVDGTNEIKIKKHEVCYEN